MKPRGMECAICRTDLTRDATRIKCDRECADGTDQNPGFADNPPLEAVAGHVVETRQACDDNEFRREVFGSRNRVVVLPCGHAFCRRCVLQIGQVFRTRFHARLHRTNGRLHIGHLRCSSSALGTLMNSATHPAWKV